MRILDYHAFILAVMTIVMLFVGIFYNLKLATKFKKSVMLYLVHFLTLFVLVSMGAHMMSVAVENIPATYTYSIISQLSALAAWITLMVGVLIQVSVKDKTFFQDITVNLFNAFSVLEELVFVVDLDGTITHVNHMDVFQKLFGEIKTLSELMVFMEQEGIATYEALDQKIQHLQNINGEMHHSALNKCFYFDIRPVVTNKRQHAGYTVVIQDITEIKDSEKTLEQRNIFLEQANAKLNHYVSVSSALEAENERLVMIDHIQTTLIHQIEQSLIHLKRIQEVSFKDKTHSEDLKDLSTELRKIYKEIRSSVDKMSRKDV